MHLNASKLGSSYGLGLLKIEIYISIGDLSVACIGCPHPQTFTVLDLFHFCSHRNALYVPRSTYENLYIRRTSCPACPLLHAKPLVLPELAQCSVVRWSAGRVPWAGAQGAAASPQAGQALGRAEHDAVNKE